MSKFDFDQLFILDLANNHQGDMAHAHKIIEGLGTVVQAAGSRAALKFQFRQLDTFIHPAFKTRKDVKHIPRFMETVLGREDYDQLTRAVRDQGMLTICTPFDEESVDLILDLGIEIMKVASCSASDWPLLKRIADTNRPVVLSTAGLTMNKIDRVVSFLDYKKVDFALMHCVALYPTPENRLNLNQIELLRNRFPKVPVGFSTHEEPDNHVAVGLALAKGAQLFERHVGLTSGPHKLNAYSSSPEQVAGWIAACQRAAGMCGGEQRSPADTAEISSLRSLMRGAYARRDVAAGEVMRAGDVYFSMPLQEGQLTSGEWSDELVADRDYETDAPLSEALAGLEVAPAERVFRILLQVKGILNKARVFIGADSSIEISHHYGLERFREFGAVIIDCINRAYCKKLIVLLPRQKHPYHYHKTKEETFQLLYGDMEVELEGRRHRLQPGDTFLVRPGEWHKFHTLDGALFEEVSTTHFDNDSFYEDERIARLPREARKTAIPNWEAAQRAASERR